MMKPASTPERTEMEATFTRYSRLRRWNTRFWVSLVAAGLCLAVFHTPQNWGDGEFARGLNWGSRGVLVLSLVAIHISGSRLSEVIGYCRGKFGKRPSEIQ